MTLEEPRLLSGSGEAERERVLAGSSMQSKLEGWPQCSERLWWARPGARTGQGTDECQK